MEYVGEVRDVESSLEVLLELGLPIGITEVDRRRLLRMHANFLANSVRVRSQKRFSEQSSAGEVIISCRNYELRGDRRRERVHRRREGEGEKERVEEIANGEEETSD